MKLFKKIVRAILALIPVFSIFLSIPVNALQHTYAGFPVFNQVYNVYPIGNNKWDISSDFTNSSGYTGFLTSNFSLTAEGDSYNSQLYSNANFKYNSSRLYSRYQDNECTYGDVFPILAINSDSDSFSIQHRYSPPNYSQNEPIGNTSTYCNRFDKFGFNTVPSFKTSSIPSGLFQCNRATNGCIGGLTTTSDYVNKELLPYSYSYNGIKLQSKAVDTDTGIHYSNSFSFSDLVNTWIPTFSHLSIPLSTMDNYFATPENLYAGRSLEFKGVFEFDGNFEWHDNIQNNGSYFRLYYSYWRKDSSGHSSPQVNSQYIDCITNLITLSATNTTQLEFSCPLVLSEDMVLLDPTLMIDGAGNYVWRTDHDWRFSAIYLTTDNDDTPGPTFNSNINGGGKIPGDAQNLIDESSDNAIIVDGKDFSASLINLFGFSFINPFAPLLMMFTNQNSCAHIPTLAGMLNAESDEVCPFFPSDVRTITTPVLSIASVMLIFGFAVRWLGSSSGNMFEDTSNETLVPPNNSGTWGRRKK